MKVFEFASIKAPVLGTSNSSNAWEEMNAQVDKGVGKGYFS